jgi:superoxide dismutase, Fe-Mn family
MTKHVLPELPYTVDALEPYFDKQTMEIHHDKHHAAYVTNLNLALDKVPALYDFPVETLIKNLASVPEEIRNTVRNNGGGHLNHSLFWSIMGKNKGGSPTGELAKAIDVAFGGFDKFQEQLATVATARFGSGWAWLSLDAFGKLVAHSTANQDSPLIEGLRPLLGLDVWEHAYYLRYQNKRAEYIKAFWNVVDWEKVAERYRTAKKER